MPLVSVALAVTLTVPLTEALVVGAVMLTLGTLAAGAAVNEKSSVCSVPTLSMRWKTVISVIPVGTVKSRILRGRRMLREILDPLMHPATHPAAHSAPVHPENFSVTAAANSLSLHSAPAVSSVSTGPLFFAAKANGGRK